MMLSRLLPILLLASNLAFADIEVSLSPKNGLITDKTHLTIQKAEKGEKVTVTCSLQDEKGRTWSSSAIFEANNQGLINIASTAPQSGSYSGVDADGLLWSMALDPKATDRSRFSHETLAPITYSLTVTPEKSGKAVEQTFTRMVAIDGIKKTKIDDDGLTASLYLPPGKGPFPAVIVLGGLEGGLPDDAYVAQLANQGYAALGLAYFKTPGTPDNFAKVSLEYFGTAILWLKQQPFVNPTKIALVGSSIGAGAALLVATHYPEIRAVGTFLPAPFIFQSIDTVGLAASTFTLHGEELPFIPIASLPPTPDSLQTAYFLRLFVGSLFADRTSHVASASIPLTTIKGDVLLQTALDDRYYASALLSQYNLDPAAHFIIYKDVGHTLGCYGLPGTPTTLLTMTSGEISWSPGGTPAATAEAHRASWDELFRFLKGAFHGS